MTEAEFPLWMAIERRCNRYEVEFGSPVCLQTLLPSYFRKRSDRTPITPVVSIATGTNEWVTGRPLYLSIFLSSAWAATSPAAVVAWLS